MIYRCKFLDLSALSYYCRRCRGTNRRYDEPLGAYSERIDRPDADLLVVALVGRLDGADGAVAGADRAVLDLFVLVDEGGGEGGVDPPLQAGVVEVVLEGGLEVLARLAVVVAAEDGPGRGRDDRAPDREGVRLVGRDGGHVVVVLRLEVLAAEVEEGAVVGGEAV